MRTQQTVKAIIIIYVTVRRNLNVMPVLILPGKLTTAA